MVWPVIAMMTVTALASAYTAWKKGEISDEQYARDKQLGEEMQRKMQAPPGTAEPITFEEYEYAQKYNPQIATFVEENKPELVKEAKSQYEIAKQRQGLNEFDRLSRTGTDVIADAQREEALFDADARAKSRQASILRDRANRGLGGSGDELLAQLDSSQDAQVGARQASLDAVKQAEARRLGALGNMTGLASNIRGQNMQVEQNNANVMNSFNQRMANSKNLYNQGVANTNNQAQQFNIGNKFQTDTMNTQGRNQNQILNVTRAEQAAKDKRDFENAMATGQYDLAAKLSAQKAANDKEGLADKMQVLTATTGAGLGAYGAYGNAQAAQSAAASAQAAQAQSQANSDRDYGLRQREVELKYGANQPISNNTSGLMIDNDTNVADNPRRTRSLYA